MKNRKAEKKSQERPGKDTREILRAMTQSLSLPYVREKKMKAADELKDKKATGEGSRVTARV